MRMKLGAIGRRGGEAHRRCGGLTLIECLLASVVLAVAVMGLMYVMNAAQAHMMQADDAARAVRLAEHLMEEIASRPYEDGGAGRGSWGVSGYNGYQEQAGMLKDFSGRSYDAADQRFSRSVSVFDNSETVPELGGLTVSGKNVYVMVSLPDGRVWQMSRFIPRPVLP